MSNIFKMINIFQNNEKEENNKEKKNLNSICNNQE